ncbi:MAG: DUF1273 family protein [Clostridia bacterium]|nr:DUF1273 family protein [Clostridia bacterium]
MRCCFTGYRPHRFAFSADGLRPEHVQRALAQQIRTLYEQGCRTFISGMCAGVDLWAAAEVVRLREHKPDVTLIAAVPFSGQEKHWPAAVQKEYRSILSAADRVEVLFSETEAAADAAACYRRRNRWMVEQADCVLAVYDMVAADCRSGTAATVRYARRLQRRLTYIHPQTLAVVEETVHQTRFNL